MTVLDRRAQRRALAAGKYRPTEADKRLLDDINERYVPDDPSQLAREQRWLTALAFYCGHQYFSWDPVQRQLVYREPRSNRFRSTLPFNIVRPNVRQLVSMLGSFNPRFKVRPATGDAEDHQSANVSEKVLRHYWDFLEMPTIRWEILHHLELFGNVFVKTYFNPRGGPPNYVEDEIVSDDGQAVVTTDIEYEGEMELELVSPFSIMVDPLCDSPKHLRYLIEARARPVEWIEQNFPEMADFVPEEAPDDWGHGRKVNMRLNAASGAFGSYSTTDAKKNWRLVREMWEVPSIDFPRGRLVIECHGVILRSGDNPAPDHCIPYIWHRNQIVPDDVWGQTEIDDLLPVQRATNRMVNKKIEHVINTANPKARQHDAAGLPDGAWDTENDVLRWSGAQPPDWLPPPPMGNDTGEMIGLMGQFGDRVTSNFGPARGQYQGKVSGKAYMALIEQDIATKTPVVDRLRLDFMRWGTLLLKWVRDYVLETRLIKIVGRGESFDVSEFKGSDIGGNTDVVIDSESMMPKSKAMMMEMLLTLAPGEKWLTAQNPDHRARVFRGMGMEDPDQLIADLRQDERRARLENKSMFMGIPTAPAQSIEDQDVHFLVHTEAMKTDEYEQLPPQVKLLFEMHLQSHRDIVMPQVGVTVPPGMTMPPGGEASGMEGPDMDEMGGAGASGQPVQSVQPAQPIKPFS